MTLVGRQRPWSASEIKRVVEIWEREDTSQIAKELDRTPQQIASLVYQIRKAGYKIARKKARGSVQILIQETLGNL